MKNSSKRFLEPVYLNEQMVLNCAAYLFGGVALESEVTNKTEKGGGVSLNAGIPFLQYLIGTLGITGDIKRAVSEENRAARRYTIGGLHMSVLDELNKQGMFFLASANDVGSLVKTDKSYVEIKATLRPVDYYLLIGTLKATVPLGAQVLRDFGDKILPALGLQNAADVGRGSDRTMQQAKSAKNSNKLSEAQKNKPQSAKDVAHRGERQSISDSIDTYETSILKILDKLEADYLTSKQLEMVMWSEGTTPEPIGIVDLDTSDCEPAEIRAKLAGGSYYVLGKIVGRVHAGDALSLMQKATIWSVISILSRVIGASENLDAIEKYHSGLGKVRSSIERLLPLSIKGPAVRVAAMSICI